MTDAEKYVRTYFPNAISWQPSEWDWWIDIGPVGSYQTIPIGLGHNEIAAWADAANRLEKKFAAAPAKEGK